MAYLCKRVKADILISDRPLKTVSLKNSDIGNICGINVTVRFLKRYKHLTLTDSALVKAPVFRADHRLNIHLSGKRRAIPQTHNKQVLQFPLGLASLSVEI